MSTGSLIIVTTIFVFLFWAILLEFFKTERDMTESESLQLRDRVLNMRGWHVTDRQQADTSNPNSWYVTAEYFPNGRIITFTTFPSSQRFMHLIRAVER